MFDYRYTVTSTDGYEWGLFKTRAQAALMKYALEEKFSQLGEVYEIKEID